jgi:hypothetical protein
MTKVGGHGFRRLRGVPLRPVGGEAVTCGLLGVVRPLGPVTVPVTVVVAPDGQRGGGDRVQEVPTGLQAFEDLVQRELREPTFLELLPGAGCRDRRALAAAQRVRGDGRLVAVVLGPVDEDLALPLGTAHRREHQVRQVRLEGLCQLVGDVRDLRGRRLAVEGRVQVDALGAGRHRVRVESHAVQDLARGHGDLDALGQPDAVARVEVEDEPVRVLLRAAGAEPPLRDVQFERGLLRHPHQGRQIVDDRVLVVVLRVVDRVVPHPVRGRVGQVLLEEDLALDTVGPALPGHGAVLDVRDHPRRDPLVVLDHPTLRGAGLGVEHLVGVREREPPVPDQDDGLARGGTHSATPVAPATVRVVPDVYDDSGPAR